MYSDKTTTATATGAEKHIHIHVVDMSVEEAQILLIRLRTRLCKLQQHEMDAGRPPFKEATAEIAALAFGICAIEMMKDQ